MQQTRASLSLASKISLVFSILVVASASIVGYLVYRGAGQKIVEVSRERLAHVAHSVELQLHASVEALRADVRFLEQNPGLRGYVRAATGGGRDRQTGLRTAEWREQLSLTFETLLKARPAYTQVRLIGIADSGRELLRLDQDSNGVRAIPATELQQKGSREYFLSTIRAKPGNIILSDINLNQEYGKVSMPHMPTLRASIGVYNSQQDLFGIVVINVNAGHLFRELRAISGNNVQLMLANHTGDFLVHPDTGRSFGFDLGRESKIQTDYPAISPLYHSDTLQALTVDITGTGGTNYLLHVQKVHPYDTHDRSMAVGVLSPYAHVLAGTEEIRQRGLITTLVIALIGILLAFLCARFLSRPLEQISRAVQKFTPGEIPKHLPLARKDEIGVLAHTFQNMAQRICEQVEQLQREVQERRLAEKELRAAKKSAEEANQVKDEFLALMSHEIRTPLNAVIGMARLLQQQKLNDVQSNIVNTLKFAGENLRSLINDILDYTRIESGTIELEAIPINLGELLDNLLRSHRPATNRKHIGLHLEYAPNLPQYILGDPVRLYQILNNLLDNAVKFTEQGSVHLRAARERSLRERDYLVLEVRDTGIGISAERLPYVFERFTQARSDTARKYGGSGLGLTITKKLVELQQGRIDVQSIPGKGTSFRVHVPLTEAGPEPIGTHHYNSNTHNLPKLRVLYVEDVEYNRFLLEHLCAEWRIALDCAKSGREGIGMAAARTYDCILMDLHMPDMDGFETARRIRAQAGPNCSATIIALTAQLTERTDARLKAAGIDDVLIKPLVAEELLHKLKTLRPPPSATTEAAGGKASELPRLDALLEAYDFRIERFRRALELLRGECRDCRDAFTNALETRNTEAFRTALHHIAPHLRMLEMPEALAMLQDTGARLHEGKQIPFTEPGQTPAALFDTLIRAIDTRLQALHTHTS